MKIEVGKTYRTRDGRKVRIYAVDGDSGRPIHGATYSHGEWYAACWTNDGRFYANECAEDIIGEWTEPRPRLLAWKHRNGTLCLWQDGTNVATNEWTRAPWLDEPEAKS